MDFSLKDRKYKQIKRNKHQEIDLEEIFLDKELKAKERESEIQERKLETPLKRINFLILLILGATVFLVLLFSTFKLQAIEGEKYKDLAELNKFITSHLASERGVIYDRNMQQLVFNEVSFDLWLSESEMPENDKNKEGVLREIAQIIDEDVESLEEIIQQNTGDKILLKKDLSHQSLILLTTKIEEISFLEIKKRILRHYQNQESLSHLLGYLGKISSKELSLLGDYEIEDYVGKEGLERAYQGVLRERKGEIRIERDAQGGEISREIIKYPQSGDSLVLSLDFPLQKKIEEVLNDILEEIGSTGGVVIALNPQNGEILASVSLPAFNNNLFARGISQEELRELNQNLQNPQLNRVIGGLYPTGSMIKPLIGTAALEEKIISESTQLYGPLELCLEHKYTKEGECFLDWTFHGWTDIKRAIAESVNPFFYMIGGGYTAPSPSSEFFNPNLPKKFEGLGIENIAEYLRLFGLGERTGVDLPGEVEGRVPDPDWKENYFEGAEQQKWYLGDTYNISIGQGYFLATPLQMATAFQALANGGKIFKPKIAKEILAADGSQKEVLAEELIRENFISSESFEIIREGMLQAVSSPAGSAFSLSSLPVRVAAKTGTAQIYPKKEIYHNWITVFAPYTEISSKSRSGRQSEALNRSDENSEILLTVLIEKVEGTRIAAQKVAKEVLEWYFTQ